MKRAKQHPMLWALAIICLHTATASAQLAYNIKVKQVASPSSLASAGNDIQPLTVGDKVPDIEIENIINYPTTKARFSDFKGKLVILDFWGKYCSSCIVALPEIESLQKEFGERLQVITITQLGTKEEILKVLQRYKKTKNLKLPIVITDNKLVRYFPHQLVSHVVWIDGTGIVKAITGTEYINAENINRVIAGKAISWPVKKDIFEYDNNKPFVEFAQKDLVNPGMLYSSAFTGHLEGISPPLGRVGDSINKTAKITFYNESLLSLAQIALDYRSGAKTNDFIFEVKDIDRYIRSEKEYYAEWAKKNTYCYSLTVPINLSEKECEQIIKNDLLRWLSIIGITVKKEKRLVQCLALVQISNDVRLISPKSTTFSRRSKDFDRHKYFVSSNISELMQAMEANAAGFNRVINETCIDDNEKIDIVLKINSIKDVNVLKQELKRYGLDLIPNEKEVEMYVISEKGFELSK